VSSTSTTDAPLPESTGQERLLLAALGLPGLLLAAGTLAMLVGLVGGVDPLWHVEPVTLAEAAALEDNAEVVRLIGLGENVNAVNRVRPQVLDQHELMLTPIEAAVAAERADMVQLLLDHGVRLEPALWTRLVCLAERAGADDVRALLEPRRPVNAQLNCETEPSLR
jgi:hypothetical protein